MCVCDFFFLCQVSRWRLQFKEAEARLAELTGDKSGDAKRLVWGVGDEERFRGELDEKVRRRRSFVSSRQCNATQRRS